MHRRAFLAAATLRCGFGLRPSTPQEEETVTFEVSGLEGVDSISIFAHDPSREWGLGEQLCFMEVPPGANVTSITIPKPSTPDVIVTSRKVRNYPFPMRFNTWAHANA